MKKQTLKTILFISIFVVSGVVLSWSHYFRACCIYVKPIVDPINTLDPSKTRIRTDYMVARAIFGQFLQLNYSGEVKPGLFESWEVSEDGIDYTFYLAKGVYFHSGKVATVDDAIFSFKYLAAKDSLVSQLFDDIAGFEEYNSGRSNRLSGLQKIDDYTLKVHLKSPSFIFLVNLADPKVVVLPNLLDGQTQPVFFRHPDGIGPYQLKRMANDGSSIELSAFQSFFQGIPRIKEYKLITLPMEDAIAAFKKGEVEDLEIYPLQENRFKELSQFGNEYSVSAYSTTFVFFNGRNALFQSKEARIKIANSINVESAGKACELQFLKSNGFIPHGIMGAIDSPIPVRPTRNFHFPRPLTLLTYGNENSNCFIDLMIAQLNRAGIRIKILNVALNEAAERIKTGNYDLFYDHLTIRGSEAYSILGYFDPHSAHNLTNFDDPKITQLSSNIKQSAVRAVRAGYYRELDRYISQENIYALPLYTDIRHYFFNRNVHGPAVQSTLTMNNRFDEIWF